MTPVDPAFLLIPFLRAALSHVRLSLPALKYYLTISQEPQHPYKPTDDLIDEVIACHSESGESQSDLRRFLSLDCVRGALRILCETKGTFSAMRLTKTGLCNNLVCANRYTPGHNGPPTFKRAHTSFPETTSRTSYPRTEIPGAGS